MTCARPELQGEQEAAVESLRAWALEARGGRRPRAEAVALRGLAGTGKTVAAAELVARLAADGARVAIVAPTGRAAAVLRRKGVGEATTVHAAAYRLVGEDAGGLAFKPRRDIAAPLARAAAGAAPIFRRRGDDQPDVLVCDEASMLTLAQLRDLLARVPRVVLVGDPGQLPPVSGGSALATVPYVELEEVRRQALDSGIVRFAHAIRAGASVADALRAGAPDVTVEPPERVPGAAVCATHADRVRLNAALRAAAADERGTDAAALPPWPVAGDRVVALANDPATGWCNGTTAEVLRDLGRANPDAWRLRGAAFTPGERGAGPGKRVADLPPARRLRCLCDDGEERELVAVERVLGSAEAGDPHPLVPRTALAWWGWALTAHKAQGSEWEDVMVLDRPFGGPADVRAWRYTAATRARAHLHWL